MLIEQWRQHYNRIRPHSALVYRPPALETTAVRLTTKERNGQTQIAAQQTSDLDQRNQAGH